jgi:ribosomal protein S18 acetylase RimI-like enzyme
MSTSVSSNLSIKLIGPEKAELLSQLAIQAYNDHFKYLWNDQGVGFINNTYSVEVLGRELADPNSQYYLAYWQQQAVGYLKTNLEAPLEELSNAMELHRIYIIKKAAGRGIGKQLTQQCFKIAQSLHKEIVWLKVMASSRDSITFYQKAGFVMHGEAILAYPNLKPEYQKMYVMKKMVNAAHD